MPDVLTPETPVCAETRRRMRLDRQARVGLLRNPNHLPPPRARRAAIMGRWMNLRSTRRASASIPPGDDVTATDDIIRKLRASLPPVLPEPELPEPPESPEPPVLSDPPTSPDPAPADPVASDGPRQKRNRQTAGGQVRQPRQTPPKHIEDTVARAPDGTVQSIDVAGLAAAVEDVGQDQPVRTPYASSIRADPPPDPAAPRPFSIFSPEAWIDDDDEESTDDAASRENPSQPWRLRVWGILRPVLIVLCGIAMAGFALFFLLLLGPVG